MENYTLVVLFDPATFTPGSREDGSKMVWNWTWRWENEGLKIEEVHWVWVREGGEHSGHEIMSSGAGDRTGPRNDPTDTSARTDHHGDISPAQRRRGQTRRHRRHHRQLDRVEHGEARSDE